MAGSIFDGESSGKSEQLFEAAYHYAYAILKAALLGAAGLCLLELPVLLLFHLLALRGPLQSSPTENIRS